MIRGGGGSGCNQKIRSLSLWGADRRAYGNKLYGEYTFEPVVTEPISKADKPWTMTKAQAKDWEETRQRLLSSGADLSRYVLKPEPGWR